MSMGRLKTKDRSSSKWLLFDIPEPKVSGSSVTYIFALMYTDVQTELKPKNVTW